MAAATTLLPRKTLSDSAICRSSCSEIWVMGVCPRRGSANLRLARSAVKSDHCSNADGHPLGWPSRCFVLEASVFDYDQELGRRPELLWGLDLQGAMHLPVLGHGVRGKVLRALPRDDLVVLVFT